MVGKFIRKTFDSFIPDTVKCGRIGCDYYTEGKCYKHFSYCSSLQKNKEKK